MLETLTPTTTPTPKETEQPKPKPQASDTEPPGTPTRRALVAQAQSANLERELYRVAHKLAAFWNSPEWSPTARIQIAKALAAMIETKNATPTKGRPK